MCPRATWCLPKRSASLASEHPPGEIAHLGRLPSEGSVVPGGKAGLACQQAVSRRLRAWPPCPPRPSPAPGAAAGHRRPCRMVRHPWFESYVLSPAQERTRHPPIALDTSLHPNYARHLVAKLPERFLVSLPGARVWGRNGLVILPDGSYAAEGIYGRNHLEVDRAYSTPCPGTFSGARGITLPWWARSRTRVIIIMDRTMVSSLTRSASISTG